MQHQPSAFSSLRWVLAGTIAQRVLGVVGLSLIMRLMEAHKADYGAYRQMLSVHLILLVMVPMGFDMLLVREAADRGRYTRALYGALLVACTAIGVIALAGQSLWLRWLELGDHVALVWMFPPVMILQAAKLGVKLRLQAEMAFARISQGEFVYTFIVMFGGAALLLRWPRAESLYAVYAAAEVFEFIWLWRGGRIREFFEVRRNLAEWRALLAANANFCLITLADQGLSALGTNAPVLILGELLDKGKAGVFAAVSTLVTVPVTLLTQTVKRVAFPAMAGRSEEELQAKALLTLRGSAAFIPPVLLWMVFHAKIVAVVILGKGWVDDATPLLRYLGIYLLFLSVFSPISNLDVLRNRIGISLAWSALFLVARIAALFVGAQSGGFRGAVIAYSLTSVVFILLFGVFLGWLLRAGWGAFFGAWMRYIPLWGVLALGWGFTAQWQEDQPFLALAAGIVPAMVYAGVLWYFDGACRSLLLKIGGPRMRWLERFTPSR